MNENVIVTKIRRIIFVGKNEYAEKTTDFTNRLSCHELILHLSGSQTVRFNGQTLHCEKDTLRFLPKGENREYIVDREEPGACIDIFFDTDVPLAEEAFVQKVKNSAAVTALFKKAFSIWVAKEEGYYSACMGLLYQIFSEMQKQTYIPEARYNTIKPAIAYIHQHFLTGKISVQHLTSLCGIRETYLKKLFLQKFGVPPVKYIIGLKINYACDLLCTEMYTVAQIAEICGYCNPHFFSRQFKDCMGVCPTQFMEKYKSSK